MLFPQFVCEVLVFALIMLGILFFSHPEEKRKVSIGFLIICVFVGVQIGVSTNFNDFSEQFNLGMTLGLELGFVLYYGGLAAFQLALDIYSIIVDNYWRIRDNRAK